MLPPHLQEFEKKLIDPEVIYYAPSIANYDDWLRMLASYKFYDNADPNIFYKWTVTTCFLDKIPTENEFFEIWHTTQATLSNEDEKLFQNTEDFAQSMTSERKIVCKTSKYQPYKRSELIGNQDINWLLKGIFPMKSVCSIYGETGTGKSFLALDFALNICSGSSNWFGKRIKNVPVTYLCLEGEYSIHHRLESWERNNPDKTISNNFNIITQPFKFETEGNIDISELVNCIKEINALDGLIIIDTLSCAATGLDENLYKDMSKIMSAARSLKDETGCCIILVHHTGKDKAKGPRGHSSFLSDIDGAIYTGFHEKVNYWEIHKTKDGSMGSENYFELKVINFDRCDSDGDMITSCAIGVCNGGTSKQKLPIGVIKEELPERESLAFNEILRLDGLSSKFGKGGSPKNTRCIDFVQCYKSIAKLLDPSDRKSNLGYAKRDIEKLVKKGYLGCDSRNGKDPSWIWLIF